MKSDDSSPRVMSEKSSGADSEGDNSSGNESSGSSPRVSQRSSPHQFATDQSPHRSNRSRRFRREERAASPIRRHHQHRRRSRSLSRSRDRRDHRRREDQRERNRDRDRDYGGDRRSAYGYERDRGYRDRYGKSSRRDGDKYRSKSKYK